MEHAGKFTKPAETVRARHEQAVRKNDHTWDNFDGYQNGSLS